MIRLLKNYQFISLLLSVATLFAIGTFLWLLHAPVEPDKGESPFSLWMNEGILQLFGPDSFSGFVVLLVLVIIQSILFGALAERTQLLYKNTWLPILFFGLFNLVFPEQLRFNPELLANVFLVLAVVSMFQAQGKERALPALLNSGILCGVSFLFAPSTFLFIPVFVIGIVMFKQVRALDIFQYLFGYFLVLFTGVTVTYLLGMQEVPAAYLRLPYLHTGTFKIWKNPNFAGMMALMALVLIPTLLRLQQNFYKNTIRVRKLQQFILLYFIFSLGYVVFGAQHIQTAIGITALPLSVYFTYYFLSDKRKWLRELVFLVLLMLVILQHWKPF
ncbi:MAG: hypothetical protein GC180_05025 [Bacteroidetes bacterium]|nr:hypothetical protein [Bacteroidota bacterium]